MFTSQNMFVVMLPSDLFWIIFKDLQIWHFFKILDWFQPKKEKNAAVEDEHEL